MAPEPLATAHMNLRHLFRMSRWARNPPSERRVKLVFATVLLCLALYGIERLGFWPDWARIEQRGFDPSIGQRP
ncbi:hypothetical protein [Primorskyibacter sp. S87]|uniref:hypothetical protein n=1 Tax=Primorskyibacter sp. S87 TaxID=3415126 RepID=UPI003C7C16B1